MDKPKFPVGSCLPFFRRLIVEIKRNTGASEALIASAILGVFAIVAQSRFNVKWMGITSSVSLYVAVLAESGQRKSTVSRMLLKLVSDYEKRLVNEYEKKLTDCEAMLEIWAVENKVRQGNYRKALKDGDGMEEKEALDAHLKTRPKMPHQPRIIFSDTTPEALLAYLAGQGHFAGLVADEGNIILNGHILKDQETISALWDTDRVIGVDRKGGSFPIYGARLSILLMAQPGIFDTFMEKRGKNARALGLLARFLFAEVPPMHEIRWEDGYEKSWPVLSEFHALLAKILDAPIQLDSDGNVIRETLRFSPEAHAKFVEIYNEIEARQAPNQSFANIRDFASKLHENLARIAALLHILEGGEGDISLETLNSASEMIRFYANEAFRLFGQDPAVRDAQELEEWLRNFFLRNDLVWHKAVFWNGNTCFIGKNYVLQHSPLRKAKKLDAALQILNSHGKVFFQKIGKAMFLYAGWNLFPQQAMHVQQPVFTSPGNWIDSARIMPNQLFFRNDTGLYGNIGYRATPSLSCTPTNGSNI